MLNASLKLADVPVSQECGLKGPLTLFAAKDSTRESVGTGLDNCHTESVASNDSSTEVHPGCISLKHPSSGSCATLYRYYSREIPASPLQSVHS